MGGDERSSLRLAYAAFGILVVVPLAWGALRGFPHDFLFYLPFVGGVCIVLLGLEASLRALRSRIEDLERRRPPAPPEPPPPPVPHGYDPGARGHER